MLRPFLLKAAAFCSIILIAALQAVAQPPEESKPEVRTVTIPISIFTRQELKDKKAEEIIDAADLSVIEDKDQQQILSLRSTSDVPITLAILLQDELSSSFNLQLKPIAEFIKKLPEGSRVMVGYIRGGSVGTRQRFTTDLVKAADSLRIVSGSVASAGNGPYGGVVSTVKRFEAMPAGRRAILLVSDGFDVSEGDSPSSVIHAPDLDRAISRAQRASVAIYSFYFPTGLTENSAIRAISGQAGLDRLADETGGRSYFQGSGVPVTLTPFFDEINMALRRQFSLTYLSTHMKKGYHEVEVKSSNPEVTIEHPKGYYYR
ncbi:MAG TPA: VWA domain-containing protein [Pyrinomonadaceae bacterium]|nr:VWA domain-containing protein [Pyrinomonadaceae bacterium]